ncbi:MAG: glycine zipper 2TM domain-containing protein [Comamonadaceae bacterium]|nr:MAG: glycine zipper 2TM domain-containing protein [Comamonadaceae bacterium]
MSLIVRSPTAPAAPASAAAPGAAASAKWLWAAIGALGVSVLALGATLVMQQRGAAEPVASVASAQTARQLAAAPDGQQFLASPDKAPTTQPGVTSRAAAPTQAPSQYPSQASYAQPSAPYGQSRQVAAQAPVCATCGRVESVQAVQQAAPATGVGAVAGGVIGGLLGNQVGKGSGRTVATVAGAVGGGYLGHTVEQRTRTNTVYQMRVRMDDGSSRTFTRAQPVAEGTPMRVEGRTFRVDAGGADARRPSSPNTMRVADTGY